MKAKLLFILPFVALMCACKNLPDKSSDAADDSSSSSEDSGSGGGSGRTFSYTIVTSGDYWRDNMTATPQINTDEKKQELAHFLTSGDLITSLDGSNIKGILFGENNSNCSLSVGNSPSNGGTGDLTINTSKTLVSIQFNLEAYWKTYTGGSSADTNIAFTFSGGASELSDNIYGEATTKNVEYSVNSNSFTFAVTGGRALIRQITITYAE